jgi:hypothetical protein
LSRKCLNGDEDDELPESSGSTLPPPPLLLLGVVVLPLFITDIHTYGIRGRRQLFRSSSIDLTV